MCCFGRFPYSRYVSSTCATAPSHCRPKKNYFASIFSMRFAVNADSCCCCSWCRGISFDRKCNMHVERWKPLLSQAAKNAHTHHGHWSQCHIYENVRPDIAQCEVNATNPATHNLAYILIIHHDFLIFYATCRTIFFRVPGSTFHHWLFPIFTG